MSSAESTMAMHNHTSWRWATAQPSLWSMRAIMVTPVAVSSSTQGRIDWLAYGWKCTISPHSTRNSTTTNASMPAYCIGNSPAVRWNIWMNANALIAMAISNKEI